MSETCGQRALIAFEAETTPRVHQVTTKGAHMHPLPMALRARERLCRVKKTRPRIRDRDPLLSREDSPSETEKAIQYHADIAHSRGTYGSLSQMATSRGDQQVQCRLWRGPRPCRNFY